MPRRNIVVTDKMVRQRVAICKVCGSRVFIGEYEDEAHGDEVLAEWVLRHQHIPSGEANVN